MASTTAFRKLVAEEDPCIISDLGYFGFRPTDELGIQKRKLRSRGVNSFILFTKNAEGYDTLTVNTPFQSSFSRFWMASATP